MTEQFKKKQKVEERPQSIEFLEIKFNEIKEKEECRAGIPLL